MDTDVRCECIEKAVADSRNVWVFRRDYARFLTLLAIKFDILRNVTEDLKYASPFFPVAMDRDKDQAC